MKARIISLSFPDTAVADNMCISVATSTNQIGSEKKNVFNAKQQRAKTNIYTV